MKRRCNGWCRAALLLGLFLLLAVRAGPAAAAEPVPQSLYDLYAAGKYEDAIRAGEAAKTAPGYALAARAALDDGLLQDRPCMACLQRAETLARLAIAVDPTVADAQVWLAASLGYQARIMGMVSARLRDYPEQAKSALDAAVAAEPGNPYALVVSGAWHIEIVRTLGSFLARQFYSATVESGLVLFSQAAHQAPATVAVRYQAALALLSLDPVRYRTQIDSELAATLQAKPMTAYETAIQERAGELAKALTQNSKELGALVRKFQGY